MCTNIGVRVKQSSIINLWNEDLCSIGQIEAHNTYMIFTSPFDLVTYTHLRKL